MNYLDILKQWKEEVDDQGYVMFKFSFDTLELSLYVRNLQAYIKTMVKYHEKLKEIYGNTVSIVICEATGILLPLQEESMLDDGK